MLFYYHPVVTILAEPNFQGSLSSETIFSFLNVPELGGCLSKARFISTLAEVENCVPLFLECHFARALWTTSGWGLRINVASLISGEDILKLILNPPNAPIPTQERWTISLVDKIWKARNLQLFHQE